MARRRHLLKIALSDEERAIVRARSAAHRRRPATWARAVLLGDQGRAVKDADDWWDSLPPNRRAQVHRWVAGAHGTADPIPGQLAMMEGTPTDGPTQGP